MKTIITGLLSKAFNLDHGKIAELIKDGEMSETEQTEALNKILGLDADRIKATKDKVKEEVEKEIGTAKFQEGYKKDKKEILEQREKELKEKFGIDSTKTGIELVEEIVSLKSKGGSGGNLDEDAIKRSRIYQDLMTAKTTETEALKTEYEKKIEDINNGYNYEKTFSDVQTEALKIFNGLNPVLPQTKSVADAQVNNFIASLKNFKFDKQGERILVMNAEGKVIEDEHGNSKSFEDIVKTNASSLFEFKKNNGGGGGGNNNDKDDKKVYTGAIPKNEEELEKVMLDKTIPSNERVNIIAEYEKAQKGIE